jgi:PAS domain S-box-containing protein
MPDGSEPEQAHRRSGFPGRSGLSRAAAPTSFATACIASAMIAAVAVVTGFVLSGRAPDPLAIIGAVAVCEVIAAAGFVVLRRRARKAAAGPTGDGAALFATLFAHSGVGIAVGDPDTGTIVAANPVFARILGTTVDDAVGRRPADFFPADDEDGGDAALWAEVVAGTRDDYRLEKAVRRRDTGDAVWIALTVAADRDPDTGRPRAAVAILEDITSRRNAVTAAQQSEARLRGIFNAAAVGVAVGSWNEAAGRPDIVEANATLHEMLGYEPGELNGMPIADISHPDEIERSHDRAADLVAGRIDSYVLRKRYRRKDGSALWGLASISAIRDADGRFAHVVGVIVDVTQQYEAETALRDSEERLRATFESSAAVQLLIDPADGRIIDANPAACEFYGWDRDELGDVRITDVNQAPETEVERRMTEARRLERRQFQFRHRVASGEIRDVDVFSGPVRFGGNEQLLSIVIDVTDRVRAEAALKESEQRYHGYIDAALSAVFVADTSGRYIDVNPEACRMLGYTRDELLAMRIPDLDVTGDSAGIGEDQFAELKRTGRLRIERRLRCKDGGYVDVDLSGVTLADGRYLAFCHDVTERNRMAERWPRARRATAGSSSCHPRASSWSTTRGSSSMPTKPG